MESREQLMRQRLPFIGFGLLVLITGVIWAGKKSESATRIIQFKNKAFEVYTVNDVSKITFGYTDSSGNKLNTFAKFKEFISTSSQDLVFAVNGGMFTKKYEPLGLFVSDGLEVTPLRLDSGYGNFYLKPNGVFGITKSGEAFVKESKSYNTTYTSNSILFATQSGPMLVVNNVLHPALIEGSKNLHIRNGVGIDASGNVVFVISNEKTNFYDFASLFRDELDCANALYLDGAISKMYNQETGRNEDGKFGVMIGVVQ